MSFIKLTVNKVNSVDVTDYKKIFNTDHIISYEANSAGGSDVLYKTGESTFTTYLVTESETAILSAIDYDTLDVNFLGKFTSGGIETVSAAGALSVDVTNTLLVTSGAIALTLAAGEVGQFKFIRMKTDGGDGTLTPSALQGGTTITFNDAGDFCLLYYIDAKWHIIVNSGCTVA